MNLMNIMNQVYKESTKINMDVKNSLKPWIKFCNYNFKIIRLMELNSEHEQDLSKPGWLKVKLFDYTIQKNISQSYNQLNKINEFEMP